MSRLIKRCYAVLQDWEERLDLSAAISRKLVLPHEPHTAPFSLLSSALPIEIDISYWKVPYKAERWTTASAAPKKHDMLHPRPPKENSAAC